MEFTSAVRGALRRLSVRNSQISTSRFKSGTAGLVFALTLVGAFAATDAGATTAVGVLAGSSGVRSSGAATYNIPITMPPGTHGMQPSLALSYDSQGADGWVGYGWTLSGLSAITRCSKTIDDDGLTEGVLYTTSSTYSDDFCLDGQRLRLTGGSYYGADGSTYHTEIDGFAVITAHAGSGITGPSWFTVQTKDGRSLDYGNTADSKIVASGATTVVRTWALDRVTDLNGNYMTYVYGGNANAGLEYWPTDIYYTGNGTTINPDHQIHFDFENRPSDIRNWYTAGSVAQDSVRLHDIKIMYGGAATFTYILGYQQDSANGRNLLNNVQECGADGSCLPATTIAWTGGGPGEIGWGVDQSTGITVADAAHANAAHLMDVDGDGIDDLVYPDTTSGDWKVAFGLPGGGFTSPVDTGDQLWPGANYYQYALAMNYDGSGRTALAVPIPNYNGWQVLVPTGSRAAGQGGIFRTPPNVVPNTNAINSTTNQPIYVGNVWMASSTGNGLSDMYDNTGSALQLQQNEGPNTGGSNGNLFTASINVASGSTLQNLTNKDFADVGLDFDGSGRIGALANNGNGWFAYAPSGIGSTSALTQLGSGIPAQSVPAVPVDFNGDGVTDLLSVNPAGQFQVSISTGTGFVTQPTNDWYIGPGAFDTVVADYYGNGTQVALVYAQTAGNVNGWNMISSAYSAVGGNFSTNYVSTSAPYPTANFLVGSLRVAHIDASGMDDLVYVLGSGTSYTFHYELHSGAINPQYPDLVSQVTDGLGNYCVFQYQSLASGGGVYSENIQNNPATYPNMNVQPAMQVVAAYSESNGIGSYYTLSYSYSGAQFDPLGRGFLGFYNQIVTDSRNSNEEWTYFDQAFPWIGWVINDATYMVNSGQLHTLRSMNTTPDYLVLGSGNQIRYMPYNSSSVTHDYDPAGVASGTAGVEIRRTVTAYDASTTGHASSGSFDQFGNILHFTTEVFDEYDPGSPTFTTTTTSTYNTSNTYNNNCVGLPTLVTVTKTTLTDSETRTTTPTLDTAHCQLAASNSASSPSITVQGGVAPNVVTLAESYSYDGFGNISQTVISGSNVSSTLSTGGRTTTAVFSGNGEFATSSGAEVSSALTLSSGATWRYDLGLQATSTDPNGLVTNMQYDAYGRPTKVTRPDGTATTWLYQWCNSTPTFACPANAIYEVVMGQVNSGTTSSITTGYTAYDTFGRVVEQGKKLLGGALSLVDTTYNGYGAVGTVTDPYLPTHTIYTNLYCYYAANGMRFVSYEPETSGDSCGTATGASGAQVVSTYSYSAFTSGTKRQAGIASDLTDTSGATQGTSSITDALGEVTNVTDAKGGTTAYSYDTFGDLIGTVDADTKSTTIKYDGLGHKNKMIDPNMGTWIYQVDALGEVLCQTDAKNQSIIMSYDNLGRLVSKLETAAGVGCTATSGYTGSWTYDNTGALGLPAKVSDSNGFQRSYAYDGLSRPSDVTTTIGGTPYDVSTTYDSFGRVATVAYPASVTPVTASVPTVSASASPSSPIVGNTVTLTSTASNPNSLPMQYAWTQTAGPTMALSDPDEAVTTFSAGTTGNFSFSVTATDSTGGSASGSVNVTVTPAVPGAPTVPSVSGTGSYSVSWSQVTGADSYKLYESVNGGAYNLLATVVGGSTTSYSISGKANGTYAYELAACGNSACSAQSPASTTLTVVIAPGVPGTPSASPDPATSSPAFTLSWAAATGAVSYYVVYSSSDGTTYDGGTNEGNTTSIPGSINVNGTYYFKVTACATSNGQTACSNPSGAGTEVISLPVPHTTISASPSSISQGSSSTLDWTWLDMGVSYYVLSNGGGTVIYQGTATSYVVSPLVSKTYYLQGCNIHGCGPASSTTVTVTSGTCKTCSPVKPSSSTPASGSSTTPAPAPASSGSPVGAVIAPASYLPASPSEQDVISEIAFAPSVLPATVQPVQPPAYSATVAALYALGQQRQALSGQPMQPSETTLQAKYNRLMGAVPQTLALAGPKLPNVQTVGTMTFAPPVYQAYAGLHRETVTGSPYRFTVQYNYDPASGALQAVADANTGFIYWRVDTDTGATPVDAFGHLLAYMDGNNVSTVTAYDPATGAVTGIGTGIGGSSSVQQLAYSLDSFGNLIQRCDANRGLVENFTYDGLNRLSTSKVYSGGTVGSCNAGSTAGAAMGLTYDAIGNIKARTNTGITVGTGTQNDTYAYGDPNHPYAVTGVTSISGTYAYDANGNMTSGNGRSITWNDDNLPTYIASTGTVNGNNSVTGSSTFSYGPDLQRYQQSTTDSVAGNSTTTYVGGLFEVYSISGTTQYRHNIIASGGIVAVHTLDQSGNASTSYMHSDHLGSSDTITNDAGAVTQQTSFDAFGLRRDAATWAYDLTGTQISSLKSKTDRGFTLQEQLDNVGLVHMNGRVYDPTIGRFISSDPTISRPLHSQGFNRYSYVQNNPLAYTDPSGFTLEITICCGVNDPQDCCDQGNADGPGGNGGNDISGSGHFGGISGNKLVSTAKVAAGTSTSTSTTTGNSGSDGKTGDTGSKGESGLGQKPSMNGGIGGNCGGGNSNCVPMSNVNYNRGFQAWDGVCFCSGTGGGSTGLMHGPLVEDGAGGGSPNPSIGGGGASGAGASHAGVGRPDYRKFVDSNGCIVTGGPALCFGPMGIEELGATALARLLGKTGEAAVRGAMDIGPATKITISNGANRIPDGLKPGVLSEVKNVSYLSATRQILDFLQFAGDNELQFDLYVRPTTEFSGPLQNLISSGQINLKYIPGP